MDIKPLRYFVTLAQTRHFGRAAALLHISQPPLSRQLAALEADLGVRLVERSPHSVTLTAAGERFYGDARAILAALDQARSNARAVASGVAGTLTIGFTMCAAYSVVPGYARRFGSKFPEVTLNLREVVSNDLSAQVLNGQIDAAILFPGTNERGLASRMLISEPLCVALSREHPMARSRTLKIARLAGQPFVLAATEVAPTLRAAIMEHCRSSGFEPDIRFEVQLQQTVLSLVNEGVGVALVPASMSKVQLEGVVFRKLDNAPLVDQVLLWSSANRNPCLQTFLDMV
ncbi:LysR family transcriptional regulator [Paraburkholderia caballeronis]|uniref:LysR family transcriptional regulator n=1 Tax=Paraburkholderia caballeronis TaxID=416943 RepID=UPI001064EC63|nr:LysR family transcriptional regulator [Paraburkholderia caballeronis]TDV06786.1 LysR family transcriptional regulator [Paraburkholderia caballeronis]TDV09966.1 LysR family transcriptional regulator [Paraburkholderia caballeronis]TDV21798.1 LysR family transcriptional regulator [Paraburkholderia caballeronis]TDV26631.1 LysR family transcriptional regulator [Paraburkholderia caballeronis]